jgi:hypothetical protein
VIRQLIKAAVLVAAFAGASAHADTFDFSYTFNGAGGLGGTITGSFQGTQSGQFVTDVSNVSVVFDGTAFNGPLFSGTSNSDGSLSYGPSAAVISFNASQNNFVFADSNDPQGNGVTTAFLFNSTAGFTNAFNTNVLTNNTDGDDATGQWSLKEATPVPVPAALPLLASGLGFLFAKRRRRAA